MLTSLDIARAVATAQIVAPETVARDINELVAIKLALHAARMEGEPLQLVAFEGGALALINADPSDEVAWRAALRATYLAAGTGYVGPVAVERPEDDYE